MATVIRSISHHHCRRMSKRTMLSGRDDPAMEQARDTVKSRMNRQVEEIVSTDGVPQSVFLRYIKSEIENEQACLELPLTILLLISFSVLAVTLLRQDQVLAVEHAIEFDIGENANFAIADNMLHKTIADVHCVADFWSWMRLGLLPLFVQPTWSYSEPQSPAFGEPLFAGLGDNLGALPERWLFKGNEEKSPMRNEYRRYTRMIGGIRMLQQIAPTSYDMCRYPSNIRPLMEKWYGKPCAFSELGYLSMELEQTETHENPARVEWLLPELASLDELRAQLIDMEDGCNLAATLGREMSTCRCRFCRPQEKDGDHFPRQPWIDEQTLRLEVSMIVYNPQYGMYTFVGVNFLFARGGRIHKFTNLMSTWADMSAASAEEKLTILISLSLWVCALLYVLVCETREMLTVVRQSQDRWWRSLSRNYVGIWNAIDWVSILVGVFVCLCYATLQRMGAVLNSELTDMLHISARAKNGTIDSMEYGLATGDFFEAMLQMSKSERLFRLSLCLYTSIVMLRLFKSFAAQPRLALVTATLQGSSTDMLHFGIVFFSVYVVMMVNSVLMFGQDLEDYATVARATHSCFLAIFGEWNWDLMGDIGMFKAAVWFWLFQLIMVLILLNMLLAIIMEAYSEVAAHAQSTETLLQQVQNVLRRRKEFRTGRRIRLQDIIRSFEKDSEGDHEAMLSENRKITPEFLVGHVPKMQRKQAERLLCRAYEQNAKALEERQTEQTQKTKVQKMIESIAAQEKEILNTVGNVTELIREFDRVEVCGDPEYDYYFTTEQERKKGVKASNANIEDMVSETSLEISKAFVQHLATIEKWQDAYEKKQHGLHHLIAEMQLMVNQQSQCIAALAEVANGHAAEDESAHGLQ
eukprot:TRINITY_DN19030_c0_g1_i2.p1 TRINITY_DN19030_c0_g1~~TRINITY_DN19030_c0_g1_i2.p1  ORF type:complete len:866 (-),score=138.98 TRINITY_DN19030_c0_g1_i2:486-3083(-)